MYKSKLQELCQRQSWELPEYKSAKEGTDHMPRFTASVNVHGQLFETPDPCKSSKEAQNTAARIAFDYFTSPSPAPASSSAPSPPLAVSPDAPPPQIQPLSVRADPPPLPLSPLPSSLPNPPIEGHLHPKRAKSSPSNLDVNARLLSNPPSDDSNMENSTFAESVLESTGENTYCFNGRLIFPRKSNWPIPDDASVMPYSNDQWVAYRVKLDQK